MFDNSEPIDLTIEKQDTKIEHIVSKRERNWMTHMQWNIDDVPIFIAVVEQKGISAAAARAGISKSTVSKSIRRLEDALGVRLFNRNSRYIRITSEGEAFYHHALLIMEEVNDANAQMAGLISVPSGKLVVALPMAFSREIVAHNLPKFYQQYPDIDLEIIVTSHPVDIIRDQIDIAVVIGSLDDSELIVKTIYESKLVWVTSPQYAKKNIFGNSPEDLLSHIQICEKRYAEGRFPIKVDEQRKHLSFEKNIIHVNDSITVREAVIHGCGISFVPDQYCKKQLQNGELIKVFDHIHFESSSSILSVTYPSRRLISGKTRVFLDFLVRICREI